MRLIERIFVHCTENKKKWGVKELWDEFKHKVGRIQAIIT